VKLVRPIGHDTKLSLVDHLDELRSRIIVSIAAFGVALGLCFWQNHLIIDLMNRPLDGKRPITLGPAEAFTTTFRLAAYAAIVLTFPVILYQAYAFLVPALGPRERRIATPLLLMVPALFLSGVAFGYLLVMPAALKFLLHFNADQFQVQVRASDYYGFASQTLIACGIVFQVPVGILALTRLGVVSAQKLRRWRRYAIVVNAVIAMALPGVDPVSMLLEMLPLLALYEISILLAVAFGQPEPLLTGATSDGGTA
jgi:sec-independent protein translocase protein TatC